MSERAKHVRIDINELRRMVGDTMADSIITQCRSTPVSIAEEDREAQLWCGCGRTECPTGEGCFRNGDYG